MSDADRDLVAALRSELAAIDPARPCDRRALALGLGRGQGRGATARLAIRLGLGATGERSSARSWVATPAGTSARASAGSAAVPSAAPNPETRTGTSVGEADDGFDWPAAREHCRLAYLRGLFLAHGSLSISGGRTHLEFVVDPAAAPILTDRLAELELPASWRIRRRRGVVTWKSTETVGTFLRRVGAAGALLELEARQVSRAMRGDMNRVINAESANLTRAVEAASRQLAAIDDLATDGRLARQPHLVRLVADARRETPEATLTELAERLAVHRSAVQRSLERIERLALHPASGRSSARHDPTGHPGRLALA
jgi:WhiA LAGLIDADG-like domain/WhiA C-terminal HTH domain